MQLAWRRAILVGLWCLVCLLGVPTLSTAQAPVQNPTAVIFTPSPDHDLINTYLVEIRNSLGAVIQTIDVGKPTPDAQNECRATLNVQPIAFGSYTITMRSVAGGITGPQSTPTEVWTRAPGPPSKPRTQ